MAASLAELFGNETGNDNRSCYLDASKCPHSVHACSNVQGDGTCLTWEGSDYTNASAVFVLIAAIIVFFMKAGFMLVECSFTHNDDEKRQIIIIKNMDAFASAFGFFLIGCDVIGGYVISDYPVPRTFFEVQEPLLWFFKFTFASNAATLIGGCLVNFKYKLRLPAAFISAFVISGILHPLVARVIWGYSLLSPFRFCDKPWDPNYTRSYNDCVSTSCSSCPIFDKLYAIDFAGGGAVHLLGGVVGLVLCLFAKFAARKNRKREQKQGFFLSMYPVGGGTDYNIEKAALGVLILWVAWFAFNCGSTETIDGGRSGFGHAVPARVAVNMILCCVSGGSLAVAIACWAQVRYQAATVNANEIANGVLSCLVAITSSCAILEYYQACFVGVVAVIVYHFGCFCEYKLSIPDTARVVPVHAMCGLLSLMVVPFAAIDPSSKCILHAAFEVTVRCQLRIPDLSFVELLLAQVLTAMLIVALGASISAIYFVLYIIPVEKLFAFVAKVSLLNFKNHRGPLPKFTGSALFSGPEDFLQPPPIDNPTVQEPSTSNVPSRQPSWGGGNPLSLRRSLDGIMEGQSESDSEDDSIESTDLQKDHFVDVEVHDRDEASQK